MEGNTRAVSKLWLLNFFSLTYIIMHRFVNKLFTEVEFSLRDTRSIVMLYARGNLCVSIMMVRDGQIQLVQPSDCQRARVTP